MAFQLLFVIWWSEVTHPSYRRLTFSDTLKSKWAALIPVLITLISGIIAFYSGFTWTIYQNGYYGVFSINNAFVGKDVGFINSSLLKTHIDLIIVLVCFAALMVKAYSVLERITTISRSIQSECSMKVKMVFLRESILFILKKMSSSCVTFTIVFYLDCLVLRPNTEKLLNYVLLNVVIYTLSALFLSWMVLHLYDLETKKYKQEKRAYVKYRIRDLRKNKKIDPKVYRIKNSFRIPKKLEDRKESLAFYGSAGGIIIVTVAILIYFLGAMLVGIYYVGKMDAINQKDYYITSDNSHIALPVSTDKYAIIPADFIDDSLIIYTNKPVTYQNNDISVQISSFEQTVIIDKHGEVVDDMIGRFILSQDI